MVIIVTSGGHYIVAYTENEKSHYPAQNWKALEKQAKEEVRGGIARRSPTRGDVYYPTDELAALAIEFG